MTVYKYFIKMALKNKGIILSYALIFFILSLINGADTTERNVSFRDTKLNIGIVDNSNTELSRGLRNYLGERNNLIDTISDEGYIKEQIFLQIADAVIVIPSNFDEKVVNKEESVQLYKDSRKIESMQIKNQISKFLTFINATYENGEFDLNSVNLALDEKVNVELIGSASKEGNDGAKFWFMYYYNFTSYIIIAIYIAVLGLIMTDFTDKNIESRMKISSKRFLSFNREMYLGQLTVASVITLIFILASLLMKGKYVGEVDFVKYVINIIVFSFSILCLTFLINNLTRNKFIINGLSTVLSLGTSFISGVMVPQELLGEKVLAIAKFFPTYYFVRINEMHGSSFFDMRYEIFMQLLFGVAFLTIGLYFSKLRQKA